MILESQPADDVVSQEPSPSKSFKENVQEVISYFVPKNGFFITPIIIYLNVSLFLLMLFYGVKLFYTDGQIFINWGANFKPLTVDNGEWWRIFTGTFIHADIIHLAMNMYGLLFIGILLEPYLGKVRFAVYYFLTGLSASTTSLFFHDYSVCIGASGSIFGMYGIFLALLTTNLIEKSIRYTLLASSAIFIGYSLIMGIKGGVDNAAHIGGLVTGTILGYGAYFTIKKNTSIGLKAATLVLSSIITFSGIITAFQQFPKQYSAYEAQMKKFDELQADAMEFYTDPYFDAKIRLNQIVVGLDRWNRCIEILDSVQSLNVSNELKKRAEKLREYVSLRIETYEILRLRLLNKEIDEEQLTDKFEKIEILIEYLSKKQ